jgi:transcriptional regulator with XRE-family HTH domain
VPKIRMRATDVYIGERLRLLRNSKGVSQMELGKVLGITFQQVQKYEAGSNRISASALLKAAQCLSVSPLYFFEGLWDTGAQLEAPSFDEAALAYAKTPEGTALLQAFLAIPNPAVRRQFLGLVNELAGKN